MTKWILFQLCKARSALENPLMCLSWVFIGRTDTKAETPILWSTHAKRWLTGKDPVAGRDWGQEEKGTQDEMVGWHHRLDGHECEQALGVGDGQGGLAWGSPWGCIVGHDWATELNWNWYLKIIVTKTLQCLTSKLGFFHLQRETLTLERWNNPSEIGGILQKLILEPTWSFTGYRIWQSNMLFQWSQGWQLPFG